MVNEFERLSRDSQWTFNLHQGDHPLLWVVDEYAGGTESFSEQQLKSLEAGADAWWYRTRNVILHDALSKCAIQGALWDVGSGSGAVAAYLQQQGREVIAVEPGKGGAAASARLGVPSIRGSLDQLALPSHSIVAVGMFDVLEHLEHRPAILAEVRRVLAPGGHLVLTLPALRLLWSGSDVAAGHFLRYSKRTIRRELEAAGFTVVRSRYFFVLTVLPLLLLRAIPFRLGRDSVVADEELVTKDAGFVGRLAARVERLWARVGLLGSSLLVVANAN